LKFKNIEEKRIFIQQIFLFALIILIIILAFLVISFNKYGEEVIKNPLIYGMERYNYSFCECIDKFNNTWKSSPKGFYRIVYYNYTDSLLKP
jgi:hypothetical protein